MMKKPTQFLATAVIGVSVLLTSACGGASRPSVQQIENAIVKSTNVANIPTGLDKSVYTCIATAIHDSKLSDSALNALVDAKATFNGGKADDAAMTDVSTKIMACVK